MPFIRGDVDLLVAQSAPPLVSFLRNRGDGRFAARAEVVPRAAPVRILAADLNGDEWPDLAFLDAAGSLTVLHNRGR